MKTHKPVLVNVYKAAYVETHSCRSATTSTANTKL